MENILFCKVNIHSNYLKAKKSQKSKMRLNPHLINLSRIELI